MYELLKNAGDLILSRVISTINTDLVIISYLN